jgi:hypothetical protein
MPSQTTTNAKTAPQTNSILAPRTKRQTQEPNMKIERRWLKSAIAASVTEEVSMPWQRDNRTRPEAMKAVAVQQVPVQKTFAMAAR